MTFYPTKYELGKFDGGQGAISVYYNVEEKEDYLSEDEFVNLTEEIGFHVAECTKLIDKEDFDTYNYFKSLCESIPDYGPLLSFS